MFWYPDELQNDIFLACGNICLCRNKKYFFIKIIIIVLIKQAADNTGFVLDSLTYTTTISIFSIIEFQTRMIKSQRAVSQSINI